MPFNNNNNSMFNDDERMSTNNLESRESRRTMNQDNFMNYDDNFEKEAVVQTEIDENAIFTIDGERYPA